MSEDKNNMLMTLGRQAKQGASFGFADEIQDFLGAGGAYAVLQGMHAAGMTDQAPVFENLLQNARMRSSEELAKDWEDNPATSIVGQIAGFVPFAIGQAGSRAIMATSKAPQLVMKAAERIAETGSKLQAWAATGSRAARAGKGAVVGAGSGAVSGLGSAGDTASERGQGALLGSTLGAAVGAGGGAVSRGVLSSNKLAQQAAKQSSFNKAEESFMRDLLMRPDLTELQKQNALYNAISKKTGIPLTLAERIAQTDIDPTLGIQGVLAKAPETSGQMQSILRARMGDPLSGEQGNIATAIQNTSQKLSAGDYDTLAQQLVGKSSEASKRITSELSSQAAPLYEKAFTKSVNPKDFASLLKSENGPILNNYINAAYKDERFAGSLNGLQPNNIKVLDAAKRLIDEKVRSGANPAAPFDTRAYNKAIESLVSVADNAAPEYKQARSIYSGQPEMLTMRKRIGGIADIDELKPEQVSQKLYKGTPATARIAANALGADSSAAAAIKLQDILGGLKTGNLPQKIDADTLEMLRIYSGGNANDVMDLMRGVERARLGERYLRGSQTQANTDTSNRLADAAGAAIDVATGGKTAVARKVGNSISEAIGLSNSEKFNRDMANLLTTSRGDELLEAAIKKHNELKGMSPKATVALPAVESSSNMLSQLTAMPEQPRPYAQSAAALTGLQAGGVSNDYQPRGVIQKGAQEYQPKNVVRRRQ